MINENQRNLVRNNWIRASEALGFRILLSYKLIISEKEKTAFAFLPEYGSKNGAIIELTSPPDYETDKKIITWAKKNECFCSFLNVERYLTYNEKFFIETLEDWGKFTP